MNAEPSSPTIRLPVWRLVTASLISVFYHLDNFVGRVWPWVAITILMAITFPMLGIDLSVTRDPSPSLGAGIWIVAVLYVIASVMVVVNWHRGLLLGEPGGATAAFRFDRAVWRYVGVSIIIGLLIILWMLPLGAVLGLGVAIAGGTQAKFGNLDFAVQIAVTLVMLSISARYVLALPMAAIGADPPLLRGARQLVSGNIWRLAAAMLAMEFVSTLLGYAVDFALGFVAGVLGGHWQGIVRLPVDTTLVLLHVGLAASLASYAYAVLTNHPLGREVTG